MSYHNIRPWSVLALSFFYIFLFDCRLICWLFSQLIIFFFWSIKWSHADLYFPKPQMLFCPQPRDNSVYCHSCPKKAVTFEKLIIYHNSHQLFNNWQLIDSSKIVSMLGLCGFGWENRTGHLPSYSYFKLYHGGRFPCGLYLVKHKKRLIWTRC